MTYSKSPGEDAEVYQVHYDVIVTAMGYSTAYDSAKSNAPIPGEPTVKDMVGERRMEPEPRSKAPVLTDAATGSVRIVGYAAGDAVNVSDEMGLENDPSDKQKLINRRAEIRNQTSADSPDDRVVEGVGISARVSNRED